MTDAKGNQAFLQQLDEEQLNMFNEMADKTFSGQAQSFLNAFWDEVKEDAEFIFLHAWDIIKMADMQAKAVSYVHLYEEGKDLDFDMGLYFFEQMCKRVEEQKELKETYPRSMPTMMTSIVRKKELRDKVDVNFDGRVSFLEYLLYQYEVSPLDLILRSMGDVNEEVRKAQEALDAVNAAIAEYEAEKQRLEDLAAEGKGVKSLTAKNQLAQMESSPLWENLQTSLIKCGAQLRKAQRSAGSGNNGNGNGNGNGGNMQRCDGQLWWINRELQLRKERYGR
jgi:hypothetical protein